MSISKAYNMDCMEAMRQMPDKCFGLAVVDPPYGIGMDGGCIGYKGFNVFDKKDWDKETPPDEYFEQLFRVSKSQIIFGGNYFRLPPTRCYIVWDKGAGFRGRTYAEAELAWTSFDANTRIFEHDPLANRDYCGKIHPTQKPVALYRWIFQRYAKPGDKILDTHLGSGSSRIAAYEAGLDFYGFEIDKTYFDLQEERFKAHTAQLSLFTQDMSCDWI